MIHGFGSKESSSRFEITPRDDLVRTDLHGKVQQKILDELLSYAHWYFNKNLYPSAPQRFCSKNIWLLFGLPGMGKTFTVQVASAILDNTYGQRIVFLRAEGSSIDGAVVGSGPAALREITSMAQKAVREGKLPFIFINEGGSLIRSREMQGMQLDGGSSLSTHTHFLTMLSGPNEVPGILVIDLNTEKEVDEATRQRCNCVEVPPIDRYVMRDMFLRFFDEHPDIFEGVQEDAAAALQSSLDTEIGTVFVGSDAAPVTVGHLSSGRLFENVIGKCINSTRHSIYQSHQRGIEPPFNGITAPLLYTALTESAWSHFKCWKDGDARKRLVHEMAREEKAHSISKPTAYEWSRIEVPPQYNYPDLFSMLDDDVDAQSFLL